MTYAALPKLKKNSVPTTLSSGINDSVTTIPVTELSRFHDADNNLITSGIVIGYDSDTESDSEEITITGASATSGAGNLTGATRGVNADGTIGAAKAWDSGTNIAVMFSTGIYDQICDNITDHETSIGTAESNIIAAQTDIIRNTLNIYQTSFYLAYYEGITLLNMIDGYLDAFNDESGIDATLSLNEIYDSGGDFYTPDTGTNMTLIPIAYEAEEQPDYLRWIGLIREIDSITLNTDLLIYGSRDDGSNWVQGTLVSEGQAFGHYVSQYPPAQNDTYVKATGAYFTFYAHNATNPANSVTGSDTNNQWLVNSASSQRFHIDLGSAKLVKRIYFENAHNSGGSTTNGVQNFILQGSNESTAFAELTYGTDTNWTTISTYSDEALTTPKSKFDEHVASNVADPQYLYPDNSTEYRYYAIKCVDNYGAASYMGIRRVELQTGEATLNVVTALIDVSTQAADQTVRSKLVSANNKDFEIHSEALQCQ